MFTQNRLFHLVSDDFREDRRARLKKPVLRAGGAGGAGGVARAGRCGWVDWAGAGRAGRSAGENGIEVAR